MLGLAKGLISPLASKAVPSAGHGQQARSEKPHRSGGAGAPQAALSSGWRELLSVRWCARTAGAAIPAASTSGVFPNAFVRSVGPRFPTLSVELLYLQAREVYAFEAAHLDHVLRGVSSRSVGRRHTATAAKEMARDACSELIGFKIFSSGDQTKPLGGTR
jgi:hypothetical protein